MLVDLYVEDSDSEEEVEPLYIPKIGNSILWIKYTTANTIWLTVGGYDSEYVYEYDINQKDPLHSIELRKASDMEINSYFQMYVHGSWNKFIGNISMFFTLHQ